MVDMVRVVAIRLTSPPPATPFSFAERSLWQALPASSSRPRNRSATGSRWRIPKRSPGEEKGPGLLSPSVMNSPGCAARTSRCNWSATSSLGRRPEAGTIPSGSSNYEREPSHVPDRCDGACSACRSRGFHAWRRRPASGHGLADVALLKRVRTIHVASRATYGVPRVHAALRAHGDRHGRKPQCPSDATGRSGRGPSAPFRCHFDAT